MKVRFKKLVPGASAPKQGTPGSAGFDLTATSVSIDRQWGKITYGCGLAMEIPPGHVGLLFPRSSIHKLRLVLSNAVGLIDSDYRGEIKAVFYGAHNGMTYKRGERFAQLVIMPIPEIEYEEADELSETSRGAGGYGSTGR